MKMKWCYGERMKEDEMIEVSVPKEVKRVLHWAAEY